MKKRIAFLLIIALVFAVLPTHIFAETGETIDGYATTMTGALTNSSPVHIGDTIVVHIGVNKAFAAAELTVTYEDSVVAFQKEASELGSAAVQSNEEGVLVLADYGSEKAASEQVYRLAFSAKNAGEAVFAITSAGFGTAEDAIAENLTQVEQEHLAAITIAVKPVPATVTFQDDAYYCESILVEIGDTFTFYPERMTGQYYEYVLPIVTTENGTFVDVIEIEGGWQIADVTENMIVYAADRSPRSFGPIDYTKSNCQDEISGFTEEAVYNTPIEFTIPADLPASEEEGYSYTVSAWIGGQAYALADPDYPDESSRTYTIPGEDVTGEVVITVTKTTFDPTRFTVNIGGDGAADGMLEGAAASGAPVQVDKNGNVILTVDTESGLNKGYDYVVMLGDTALEKGENGYLIPNVTQSVTVTIAKTVKVAGVKHVVDADQDGEDDNYLTVNREGEGVANKMWLIQLPNHVKNTSQALYKYQDKPMYWSEKHQNFVIVVFSENAPDVSAENFSLEKTENTPTVAAGDWDVNRSGTVDANDAQLIWNMYKSHYSEIDELQDGATTEKFLLADANGDGVLDTNDAVVIIHAILNPED